MLLLACIPTANRPVRLQDSLQTMIFTALAFGFGLLIGSFIGALTWRWPTGRSIVAGRSQCDHCNATVEARDLVPVLSFIMLGGRCRHCNAAIAPRHLAIELVAGAIGALAMFAAPNLEGALGAVFGWALLTLAILDVEHFWLPDRLVLPLAGAGLLAGIAGPPDYATRLIGAVVGFAVLKAIATLYHAGTGRTGLGGGDPKLLAAIGAWLGWQALAFVLLLASALGLVLVAGDRLRGRAVTRHSRVPLGALLAAAAWSLWLAGRFGNYPW